MSSRQFAQNSLLGMIKQPVQPGDTHRIYIILFSPQRLYYQHCIIDGVNLRRSIFLFSTTEIITKIANNANIPKLPLEYMKKCTPVPSMVDTVLLITKRCLSQKQNFYISYRVPNYTTQYIHTLIILYTYGSINCWIVLI